MLDFDYNMEVQQGWNVLINPTKNSHSTGIVHSICTQQMYCLWDRDCECEDGEAVLIECMQNVNNPSKNDCAQHK